MISHIINLCIFYNFKILHNFLLFVFILKRKHILQTKYLIKKTKVILIKYKQLFQAKL